MAESPGPELCSRTQARTGREAATGRDRISLGGSVNTSIWLVACALSVASVVSIAGQQTIEPDHVDVEDADTLLVRVAGTSYRVQLPGIDAPESVTNPKLQRDIDRTGLSAETLLPLGRAAIAGLRRLLPSFQPYRLVFDPGARDRYGRTPGDLVDDQGVALSLRLVEAGFALPARPGATREQALREAAERARHARRGLWQSHPEAADAWAGPAKRE